MIPSVREAFNAGYKEEFYEDLQKEVLNTFGEPCGFRISETPVFISKAVRDKVFETCDAILDQLSGLDLNDIRRRFVPGRSESAPLPDKPHFLAIDFGLCYDDTGAVVPQLIELQAFPSLMYYQPFLGKTFRMHYPNLPNEGFHYFFDDLDETGYYKMLGELILGGEDAENVILMELFPEQQKTRIDFRATEQKLGIKVVCMTEVLREGRKLYYLKQDRKIPIHRIYNRVIQDERERYPGLETAFTLQDDLDVEWITHPDWFYIISKCIMPLLDHKYIPKSYYLNELPPGLTLSDFVLKPLFSFAGTGINLDPTPEAIAAIEHPEDYLLQRKVSYAPLIRTATGTNSKVELRILYVKDVESNRMKPVINLTRMGKGGLINVSHQTTDTWIGSSISFFED